MSATDLHVAIVGSGPAGFYAAGQLLGDPSLHAHVDMFDRLPTPWGLVRAGVAPDHPKIKSVTRVFDRTARGSGFSFHGNVEVGRDVSHDALASSFDAVIYAVGAATDRRLGIPGEDLAGSHSATSFVAWYNGHPDHAERVFDLSGRRAVVVGNGNVALDVARMLALAPEELAATDVADHALRALRDSRIEDIVVLGRRGPAQAAFTTPELRELGSLRDADVVVDPADLAGADAAASGATARRNVEILRAYAERPPLGRRRRIHLRFLRAPLELRGDGRVQWVRLGCNELHRDASGHVGARATGRSEELEADLVLRSIGYLGAPIPGLPFDAATGTIPNDRGRVRGLAGVYVAGWIKRGPSGVIGTNKRCAQETIERLLEDAHAGRLPTPADDAEALVQAIERRVDFTDWERIDAHERRLGSAQGRPRVKVVRWDELLHLAGAPAVSVFSTVATLEEEGER